MSRLTNSCISELDASEKCDFNRIRKDHENATQFIVDTNKYCLSFFKYIRSSFIINYLFSAIPLIRRFKKTCRGGIMVSIVASSVVDCGFKLWSNKTKDYEIGTSMCCCSDKHAALRIKSEDWLAQY